MVPPLSQDFIEKLKMDREVFLEKKGVVKFCFAWEYDYCEGDVTLF